MANVAKQENAAKQVNHHSFDPQKVAANPHVNAWVGASAGTGKTKILVDRILRLLLSGVRIEKILCLTFTKAAAAEMQNRLISILQNWAIDHDEILLQKLTNLADTPPTPADIQKARMLFYEIIDAEGGVKIQTIHSFCQSLLERFPLESGIQPSFQLIDEKLQKELQQSILQKQLLQDDNFSELLNYISDSGINTAIESAFAKASEFKMILKLSDQEYHEKLDAFFSVTHCETDFHSLISKLHHQIPLNCTHPVKKAFEAFLQSNSINQIDDLFLTSTGSTRAKLISKKDAALLNLNNDDLVDLKNHYEVFQEARKSRNSIKINSLLFQVLKKVFLHFQAEKEKRNLLDFDDLIEKAENLISNHQATPWIMFKLDGGLEHILLDEAQDTSAQQWKIIVGILKNLFQHDGKWRTLFVVGDLKQSIYSFQGANPDHFLTYQNQFDDHFKQQSKIFESITLQRSFRTTPAVLNGVDKLFNEHPRGVIPAGGQALQHIPFRSEDLGALGYLPLVSEDDLDTDVKNQYWHAATEYRESSTKRSFLAEQIANEIHQKILSQEILSSTRKPAEPRDFMVLVRSRTEFLQHIHKALQARGISSSGRDRFMINDELPIQDIMALASFTQLPEDDYNFACILKSPLVQKGHGFNDEDLLKLTLFKKSNNYHSLWQAFQNWNDFATESDIQFFKSTLKNADYLSLSDFFNEILLEKRPYFHARFGNRVIEIFEAFLDHIHIYEKKNAQSLQSFLINFANTEVEIKRDTTDKSLNCVRLMTVHASKGLQAPVVYIADCNRKIDDRNDVWMLHDDFVFLKQSSADSPEKLNEIRKSKLQKTIEEDRRLLYVAMTRAEDQLFVTGTGRDGKIIDESWYDLVSNVSEAIMPDDQQNLATINAKNHLVQIPYFYESCPILNIKEPEKPVKTAEQDRGIRIHLFFELFFKIKNKDHEKIKKIAEHCKLKADEFDKCLKILTTTTFSFLHHMDAKDELSILYNKQEYRIDRVIFKDEKAYIIDYKTGKNIQKNIKSYEKQLMDYRIAVENIFKIKHVHGYILNVDGPELTEVF